MTLIPVYPEKQTAPPADEDKQAAAEARSRQQVFANLSQDVDFQRHILGPDGWLAEQEQLALSVLATCPQVEVIERRMRWRAIKELRQELRDTLTGAHQLIANMPAS